MCFLSQKLFTDPAKNLRLIQLKSYFEINEKETKGITNQNHQNNIGCNVESVISNHIKWLLGYGSKAFSKNVYSKMLDIHIAKVNGISIIDLVKEKMIVKLKDKQSFFRQSFLKKDSWSW